MKAIRRFLRYDNLGWLYVLPALVYMLALTGWPIVSNIMLSLQDVTVRTLRLTEKPFVGLANYRTLFEGGVLTSAIFNTLLFTVLCLVFQFVIGFLLALFFNRSFATAKFVRGLLMIPWMIRGSMIAGGIVISGLFTIAALNKFVNMKSNKIYLY